MFRKYIKFNHITLSNSAGSFDCAPLWLKKSYRRAKCSSEAKSEPNRKRYFLYPLVSCILLLFVESLEMAGPGQSSLLRRVGVWEEVQVSGMEHVWVMPVSHQRICPMPTTMRQILHHVTRILDLLSESALSQLSLNLALCPCV